MINQLFLPSSNFPTPFVIVSFLGLIGEKADEMTFCAHKSTNLPRQCLPTKTTTQLILLRGAWLLLPSGRKFNGMPTRKENSKQSFLILVSLHSGLKKQKTLAQISPKSKTFFETRKIATIAKIATLCRTQPIKVFAFQEFLDHCDGPTFISFLFPSSLAFG